jgi:hypothetical protein
MTHADRLTEILKVIDTDGPAAMGTSLEDYIADLEANKPERHAQITAIVKKIGSDHLLDMGMFLEGYGSDMEAKQQAKSTHKGIVSQGIEGQYWHGTKREQQRRARALRRQNNAQKT